MILFKKKKQLTGTSDNDDYALVYSLVEKLIEDKSIPLKPDTKLTDIGFDSIKFINLIFSFEEIVNKNIEELAEKIDVSQIETISDIVKAYHSVK